MSGCKRSGFRHFDRTGLTIERDHAAGVADSLGKEHGHVAGPAANIKHTHPGADAAFADQSPGDGLDDAGLKSKALNFKVCMTQGVGGRGVHRLTTSDGLYVAHHSPLTFAALMIGHHFSISAR